MRIFNADGGEVEACGNATRCVATLIGKPAAIETLGGMLRVTPADGGAEVTLGEPAFEWERIPLAMPMDTSDMHVAWAELAHEIGSASCRERAGQNGENSVGGGNSKNK